MPTTTNFLWKQKQKTQQSSECHNRRKHRNARKEKKGCKSYCLTNQLLKKLQWLVSKWWLRNHPLVECDVVMWWRCLSGTDNMNNWMDVLTWTCWSGQQKKRGDMDHSFSGYTEGDVHSGSKTQSVQGTPNPGCDQNNQSPLTLQCTLPRKYHFSPSDLFCEHWGNPSGSPKYTDFL